MVGAPKKEPSELVHAPDHSNVVQDPIKTWSQKKKKKEEEEKREEKERLEFTKRRKGRGPQYAADACVSSSAALLMFHNFFTSSKGL